MFTITYVRNPFDPLKDRIIEQFPIGLRVKDYLQGFGIGDVERNSYDIAVSINGQIVPNPMDLVILSPNCHLAFCHVPKDGGDGKNILAIIAMIAVIIVAPYLTEMAAFYSAGGGALEAMAVAGGGAYMTAGLTLVGGLIVGSVFRPSIPSFNNQSIDSSSTYSWDAKPNSLMEGEVLPVLYGTMRIAPPIIGRYLETAGDKQYLNILMAAASHAITSLSSSRINQTDVTNFSGITEETRLGATTQGVTQGFNDTRVTTSVATKLNPTASAWSAATTYDSGDYCTFGGFYWKSLQAGNTNNSPVEDAWWTKEIWTTRVTNGNTVQGITVCLSFPAGLFSANSSGGLGSTEVDVYIEYKKTGEVDWVRLQSMNTVPVIISSSRWSAGHWQNEWEGPSPSVYWVEVEVGSSTPGDHVEGDPYTSGESWYDYDTMGLRYAHYWRWVTSGTLTQIDTVNLDYAQIVAAQSKPLRRTYSADQLPAGEYSIRCRIVNALASGNTYINDCYWEYFEERIYDDFTYPGTTLWVVRALATDQLSGGIPRFDILAVRSTVPVWTGATYENKAANNPAWAAYDLLHNNTYGADIPYSRIDYDAFNAWASYCTTEGFTLNIYFDQAQTVRKCLDIVGQSGRANVVQMGSKFTVIVDKEDTAVQKFLFTVGNIKKDSFSEEFLPLDDRCNAIEITYFDATLNYERQVLEVYSDDFDTTDRDINKRSVILYGCTDRDQAIQYAKFLLKCNRYLTLTASWETDVDALACMPGDVVEVSHDVPQWGFSGRIISATANTVTLDRSVTIEAAKTYAITIKHQDDDTREEKTVSNSPGTYTVLTISTNWGVTPSQYAQYAFGETNLVTKQFRVIKISRAKENTFKIIGIEYVVGVYDDSGTVSDPQVWTYLDAVDNLTASERYTGGASTNALISWNGAVHLWYIWYKSSVMATPLYVGESGVPWIVISNIDYGLTYTFYVSGTPSIIDAVTVDLAIAGRLTLPAVPTPVFVAIAGGFQRVRIEWESIDNEEYDMVEIWRSATNDRTVATKVGEIHSNVFIDTSGLTVLTTYYYWIRTRSLIGTWSAWESADSAGHSVTTGGVITGDFIDDVLELELMKINFQNISWAQFAIFDSFENSTKRASPDPSTYDARIYSGYLDNGEDGTADREFGFISKTYTNITTVLSSNSTSVGLNYLEDTLQSWFTDECKNLTLYDSTATAFTIISNTSNRLTVSGSPAAGAYTLVDSNPGYAVAFATFLDSSNGGAGYVKLEVSFDGGVNYQTFLDTEGGVDLLGGTVAIANAGNDYIARITLKNDGSGLGPIFYKFLVCTDPSCWRF